MLALPSRLSQASILVVDDSQFSTRLITTALAKAGFNAIETAKDGMEAMEKTRHLKPELVILDIVMPKLDGFGYCEQVRKDLDLPRMPIIVQTMLEDRETKLRALSCGADDFLHKPLDADELVLRTRVHLERYFMLQDLNEMCLYLMLGWNWSRRAPSCNIWSRRQSLMPQCTCSISIVMCWKKWLSFPRLLAVTADPK